MSKEWGSLHSDLFRLAQYLNEKKSFILNISKLKEKKVVVGSGKEYTFQNFNHFSGKDNFVGGKTGFTNAAQETMLSLFTIVVGGETHTLAIIVLGSDNREKDTEALLSWFTKASVSSVKESS